MTDQDAAALRAERLTAWHKKFADMGVVPTILVGLVFRDGEYVHPAVIHDRNEIPLSEVPQTLRTLADAIERQNAAGSN
jgi:hypothetical protein